MAIDLRPEERDSIIEQVEEGFAQAERGELIDGDVVIAWLRKRRAERKNLFGSRMDTDGHGSEAGMPGRSGTMYSDFESGGGKR
jgi:hypothetical protein